MLDEIRSKAQLSEVAARYMKLTRKGGRWWGLSPFVEEKTPSFSIDDNKGLFYCFSSRRHGDVFEFLRAVENLSFPEAVRLLAQEARVELERAVTPGDGARARALEAAAIAADYFEEQLQGPAGAQARAYLGDRGVDDTITRRFRIGWAPADSSDLALRLSEAGLDSDAVCDAGLWSRKAHGGALFRSRVMLPIVDEGGAVIAFGGRRFDGANGPKYLNSPAGPIFHKSKCFYNLRGARRAIAERGRAIIVEGYFDVIALCARGFDEAVGALGIALTAESLAAAARAARGGDIFVMFDGNAAGEKAMFAAVDKALPDAGPKQIVSFARLPAGSDPDTAVRGEGGPGRIEEVLAGAAPLEDMLWLRESAALARDASAERLAQVAGKLEAAIAVIKDERTRCFYERKLADRLEALVGSSRKLADFASEPHSAGG